MINYKFQSKFTDDLNIPESFKLEMENEYAKQLWTGDGVEQDRAKAMDILEHLSKELHFEGKLTNRLNWGYINFLKVGGRLFVPQFGIQEDTQAIEQLQSFYSGCEIIPIFGCEELAKDGGVLNCITWTVKE